VDRNRFLKKKVLCAPKEVDSRFDKKNQQLRRNLKNNSVVLRRLPKRDQILTQRGCLWYRVSHILTPVRKKQLKKN